MFRTVPNHYGVNANAANAELVNANANVNMVNITNQGSNSTTPADPAEGLPGQPSASPVMQLNQQYGNYAKAALAVGLVGGYVGHQQHLDPKVTGILGAALGWGGYHLVREYYAQKALANQAKANMGYAG